MNYYNDNDPKSAAWLRELIKRGLISDGIVDDRSILDVEPSDLRGFTQCHFFAGVGAWSYALRLAGWPDDRPVWTGSPPCQPFSVAGAGLGVDDARHLSPKFASLVRACRPELLFGEQVASAQVFGGAAKPTRKGAAKPPEWAWLDDLSDRLEAAHYAVGASDIPSAGVGAPHIRQRTFFGAIRLDDAAGSRHIGEIGGAEGAARDKARLRLPSAGCGTGGLGNAERQLSGRRSDDALGTEDESGCIKSSHDYRSLDAGFGAGGLADGIGAGLEGHGRHGDDRDQPGWIGTVEAGSTAESRRAGRLADADGGNTRFGRGTGSAESEGLQSGLGPDGRGGSGGLEHASGDGRQQRGSEPSWRGTVGGCGLDGLVNTGWPGAADDPWRDVDWLFCRDGKWRPVEPGSFPLAHGSPARVGRLRGYGNAINPWAGKVYIEAFCEAVGIPLLRCRVDASGLNVTF